VAAVLAIGAIAAAGAALALSSGGSDSPSNAKGAKARTAPISVPQASDPAEQARQLADFLRAQARPGRQASVR
jgi:hypothetical protein